MKTKVPAFVFTPCPNGVMLQNPLDVAVTSKGDNSSNNNNSVALNSEIALDNGNISFDKVVNLSTVSAVPDSGARMSDNNVNMPVSNLFDFGIVTTTTGHAPLPASASGGSVANMAINPATVTINTVAGPSHSVDIMDNGQSITLLHLHI